MRCYFNLVSSHHGSVSTRASKYSLCSRTCGDIPSCGLQDGQDGRGPPEVEQPAPVGGNVLVMAGARAEEVAQFIVSATEPGGRSRALEAPHGPVASPHSQARPPTRRSSPLSPSSASA